MGFSGRGQSNEAPATEGHHYCVDENTERRNHYLDLAGIENYTSRFEGKHFDVTADASLLEHKKLDDSCVSTNPENRAKPPFGNKRLAMETDEMTERC